MNFFYTSEDPVQCAFDHCDVHMNKMIIEYSQLLSAAHHMLDEDDAIDGIMGLTHYNHPCAIWVRESKYNYTMVVEVLRQLHSNYHRKSNKLHKCFEIFNTLIKLPKNIDDVDFFEPPQCMLDQFKQENTIEAYKDYLNYKYKLWLVPTNTSRPAEWYFGKPDWVDV